MCVRASVCARTHVCMFVKVELVAGEQILAEVKIQRRIFKENSLGQRCY